MEELQKELQNRIAIYGLISRLMIKEVDATLLDTIDNDSDLLDLFPNYKTWDKRETLSQKELVDEYYNVDYASLFLMHLVPYESFYTRDDQMIESGGENDVLKLYNELDFRVKLSEARVVSPDHIGVELEFMYMLCGAALRAFNEDNKDALCELYQVQRGFMKEHLLEWVPLFLINAKRESRTPLYHDACDLTLDFILSDFEYLSDKLADYCGNPIS